MAELVAGKPLSRVEGKLKVTGKAVYAAENNPPGLLHAVLVCSTISKGAITGIDTSAARAQPGVQVLTDFTGLKLPFDIRQVNFYGQPVAVALAETLEQAQHAASLVQVRYTPQAAVTEMDKGSPTPAPNWPDYLRGDPDAALAEAPVVVDNIFTIAREYHNPTELPATVAVWAGDKLTLWDKTQWVQGTAGVVAEALGVGVDKVRVLTPFVGGAFGSSGTTWPHQILAAFAAKRVGRPVKLMLTRKQTYTGNGYRPTSWQRMRVGADAQGHIKALAHEARTETARYSNFEDAIMGLPRMMYASPSVSSQYRLMPIDVHPPTSMRGPGRVTGMFALECSMDILAHQLSLDPIELRRRNEPNVDQMTGLPFSTRRLLDCYEHGAQRFGWAQRDPQPRARREGGLLIGMGMAGACYTNNRRTASALARINDDGTAVVSSATGDSGPGTYTSMTQVAADTLGLPVAKVTFQLGDSALPKAPRHSGSATMATVGSAVFTACSSVKDRLIRMAVVDPDSALHGAKPQEVAAGDGRLFVVADPGRGETYQQLLKRRGQTSVESTQDWAPGDFDSHYSSYGYGAVFAEVAVDEQLGFARLRRLYSVYDVGRVVNPKLARSQAIGAMVMAVGMTFLESSQIDQRDGRIVNANFADYLAPVNADIPELEAEYLDADEPLPTPIGVKGLGELVIVAVPAALANAVFNATGKRVTELPITLDKLL